MRNGTRHAMPWLTLALAGLAVALYATLGPAPGEWVYDRNAIAAGEWWRLVTGHWVHADTEHLGWNVTGLLVLGALVERWGRGLLLGGLLLGSLAVDAVLLWGLPDMTHYCGLSGVLNTLLLPALVGLGGLQFDNPARLNRTLSPRERARVRGARVARASVDDSPTAPVTPVSFASKGAPAASREKFAQGRANDTHPLPWLVAILSLGKILLELASGAALFTHTAWASVPAAHLAGWLAGLVVVGVMGPRVCDMLPAGSDGATFPETLSTGKRAA